MEEEKLDDEGHSKITLTNEVQPPTRAVSRAPYIPASDLVLPPASSDAEAEKAMVSIKAAMDLPTRVK